MISQYQLRLAPYPRGFHLITEAVLAELPSLPQTGILHLFIQHTSAGLTINENADPTVRTDFESSFNQLVRENEPYYIHTYEGPDDMPAHLKCSMMGSSLLIPVADGHPCLGTWQGIYLCELTNGIQKSVKKLMIN